MHSDKERLSQREKQKLRRQKAKEEGKCIICIKNTPTSPLKTCNGCRERKAHWYKQNRKHCKDRERLLNNLRRIENTMTIASLRLLLQKAVEEGLPDSTLITVGEDRTISLRNLFTYRKRK